MARFDVAHIRTREGVDLVIMSLERSFGNKSQSEQAQVVAGLQACASSAGLGGTVVPVWDDGFGRMMFFARENIHPFFLSIDMDYVAANINKSLSCE